jgi:hypothetical protein
MSKFFLNFTFDICHHKSSILFARSMCFERVKTREGVEVREFVKE